VRLVLESAFDTAEAIRAAVRTVVTTYDDPKAAVQPPCAIVGMPELDLEGISSEPTAARFPVLVMVADNKAAANKLLKLVPEVAQAIRDLVEDAEVPGMTPVVAEIGGTELPGYMIIVEV
jgi:hypothetical protein